MKTPRIETNRLLLREIQETDIKEENISGKCQNEFIARIQKYKIYCISIIGFGKGEMQL